MRRSATEREEIAKKAAEEQAIKDKDAARLAKINARGRGRGRGAGAIGRGRGDAMGMGGRGGRAGASGPFGQAPDASGKRAGVFAPGGSSGGGGGGFSGSSGVSRSTGGGGTSGSRIKSEGGISHYTSRTAADGTLVKHEYREPIYPEDENEDSSLPKIDIERINLVSDDEASGDDEPVRATKIKGKSSVKSGLRPVRVQRELHKARVAVINTDSATSALPQGESDTKAADRASISPTLKKKMPSRNSELRDEDGWVGVWRDEPTIKADPDGPSSTRGLQDIMEIDSGNNTPAPHSAVDFKLPAETLDEQPLPGPRETPKKAKKSRRSSVKERPILQTEEDRDEYARHCQDVKALAFELGGFQADIAEHDPNFAEDIEVERLSDQLEGRMYLFQFPPILPPLHNPVKKEEPDNDDVEMTGITDSAQQADAVDLTKEKPDASQAIEVKTEPGVFMVAPETIPEAGLIGKLVVRQSGKVELDWGGTGLALEKGAVFDFLATTLVVDGPEAISEQEAMGFGPAEGERVGNGASMGSVMGKFVATPDWSRIFCAEH